MTTKTTIYRVSERPALSAAAAALKAGAVIVMPTETVYGLACAAVNETAVKKLCAVKQKPENVPLQYLAENIDEVKKIAVMSEAAQKLAAAFWPGPLTMILPPTDGGKKYLRGFDTLGIRVPNHEFTKKILSVYGGILAATSANLHGRPPAKTEREVLEMFDGKVDIIFLDGDIDGAASTVVNPDTLQIIREGSITKDAILKTLKK